MNSELIRKDFPILSTKVNGHQIVYFDNAATTQRPLPVVNAVADYVLHENGNPHRGAHIFAISASEAYDTSKWCGNSSTPKVQRKSSIQGTPPNP